MNLSLQLIKLGIVAFIALVLMGIGWHFGATEVTAKWRADQVEWQAREAALDAENARLIEQARETERHQVEAVNTIATQLQKAQDETKSLQRAATVGALRLSVRTAKPSNCAGQPSDQTTAAAAGNRDEARAELDPQAAGRIVAIAKDGDAAIRQLNACIDAYNAIRGE